MLAPSLDVDSPARLQPPLETDDVSPGLQAKSQQWIPKSPGNDEEEEWAANPWQAQVDAHIMQLRQAGAVFPQVNASGLSGPGIAFGVPPAMCGLPLQAATP